MPSGTSSAALLGEAVVEIEEVGMIVAVDTGTWVAAVVIMEVMEEVDLVLIWGTRMAFRHSSWPA